MSTPFIWCHCRDAIPTLLLYKRISLVVETFYTVGRSWGSLNSSNQRGVKLLQSWLCKHVHLSSMLVAFCLPSLPLVELIPHCFCRSDCFSLVLVHGGTSSSPLVFSSQQCWCGPQVEFVTLGFALPLGNCELDHSNTTVSSNIHNGDFYKYLREEASRN